MANFPTDYARIKRDLEGNVVWGNGRVIATVQLTGLYKEKIEFSSTTLSVPVTGYPFLKFHFLSTPSRVGSYLYSGSFGINDTTAVGSFNEDARVYVVDTIISNSSIENITINSVWVKGYNLNWNYGSYITIQIIAPELVPDTIV